MLRLRSPRPPADVTALLAGRAARPVTTGDSGAGVVCYARPDAAALYLKTLPAGGRGAASPSPLGAEAARLRWLGARGVPVPAVRYYGLHQGREYLLLDEMPGAHAAEVAAAVRRSGEAAVMGLDRHAAATSAGDALGLVHAIADGLRHLHATDATGCPFRHPAAERVAEARARLRAGLVDENDFDEAWRWRTGEAVLAELEALCPVVEAAEEDAVLTHGDHALENVIVRFTGGEPVVAGLVDCGRAGVADPYQDLAIVAGSVTAHLGERWLPALFARYGLREVDGVRLRFYRMLGDFF